MKHFLLFLFLMCEAGSVRAEADSPPTVVTVNPGERRQTFDGMGCGTIFYSGHITSFRQREKHALQEQFYDDLFTAVRTEYLHVMIRPDFEPKNDNEDPYHAEFSEDAFAANLPALEVCAAARKRRPKMQLFATLYTPPKWMKTNSEESGGGQQKGALKPGCELELCEYVWSYLRHMSQNGNPVGFLSICNEADWPHDQPSYFLMPEEHARLFGIFVDYLDEMARRFPQVPKPKLVAPNMLSAVDTALKYWPAMLPDEVNRVDVLGAHDYDRRGHRWKDLRHLAGSRPLWCTEWCWNGPDASPDLIKAASEYWLVMTEAFNDGANVWMAYDWAYPPRQGGEALTHVQWGQSYHKTKIYYGFRQWCNSLRPGMRVVDVMLTGPDATGISTPGVKATAFVDNDQGRLVAHVVNVQDRHVAIRLRIPDPAYSDCAVEVVRTSVDDSDKPYPPQRLGEDGLSDTLKPREMVTYILERHRQPGELQNASDP